MTPIAVALLMLVAQDAPGLLRPTTWADQVEGEPWLFDHASFRRELRLDPEKSGPIKAIVTANDEARRREVEQVSGSGLTPSAAREARLACTRKYAKDTDDQIAALLDGEQFRRYKQVSTQQRGVMAFSRPEILAALGLDEAQRTRAEEIVRGSRAKIRAIEREFKGREQDGLKELRRRLDEVTDLAVLTCVCFLDEAQKAKWGEMTGPTFVIR